MVKKLFFSTLAVLLFVFVYAPHSFSNDLMESGNLFFDIKSLHSSADMSYNTNLSETQPISFLAAANSQTMGKDDDLDDELFDDFNDNQKTENLIADPLYYFNYANYVFNDVLILYLLEPIAKGYKFVVPTMVRTGVKNFFHNLLFPVRFVNNLLQFEILDAGKEVAIFFVNSTVGVGGLVQAAQGGLDLHTADEDLSQTLGSYGIGNGFYVVWPFLGPSSLRDTIGLVGDYFITPINHPNTDFFDYGKPWKTYYGLIAADTINSTSFRIGDYEALKKAAIDPYVAIRNAYIQNMNKKIKE
ncbi:MAG: VacJ family lipoprotein [Pseudomonadota bacterium]